MCNLYVKREKKRERESGNVPLTTTVATKAAMAAFPKASASPSNGINFSTDSCRICANEMTMMIEKTRIPKGSRRLRPTGNRFCSRSSLQPTILFVVQTITVQRRSKAESNRLAIREREPVVDAAKIFPARRRMLAITLTLIALGNGQ